MTRYIFVCLSSGIAHSASVYACGIRQKFSHPKAVMQAGHVSPLPADDGTIDLAELRTLLKTGADESSMQLSEEKLEHLTNTLFTSADIDQSGAVSFDEFMGVLKGYPDLMNNLSLR